jgi:hypothetical protein
MTRDEAAYQSYLAFCKRMNCPPLSRDGYEKELKAVPGSLVNIDSVLTNAGPRKRRMERKAK